ncbi:uncharacterized protein TNCV_2173941 [Trichonephila clavipes]|nr:uncharacterized protein TNCV_2173941 [Trichonephila clavipes]
MLIVRQRTRTSGSYGEYFADIPQRRIFWHSKKAKANAYRVRRHSQRESWILYVSSITSSTSSKQLWKKVKAANGLYREFSFPILQTSDSVFSSPDKIANVLATRGLLAMELIILNHDQVTWTTPEMAPPLLTTAPHQREDVSALDRFNVHRCPTRRVFSGTGIELMTCLPWLDTLTTFGDGPRNFEPFSRLRGVQKVPR